MHKPALGLTIQPQRQFGGLPKNFSQILWFGTELHQPLPTWTAMEFRNSSLLQRIKQDTIPIKETEATKPQRQKITL